MYLRVEVLEDRVPVFEGVDAQERTLKLTEWANATFLHGQGVEEYPIFRADGKSYLRADLMSKDRRAVIEVGRFTVDRLYKYFLLRPRLSRVYIVSAEDECVYLWWRITMVEVGRSFEGSQWEAKDPL